MKDRKKTAMGALVKAKQDGYRRPAHLYEAEPIPALPEKVPPRIAWLIKSLVCAAVSVILFHVLRKPVFRLTDAVHGGGENAAGVARTLAAGIDPAEIRLPRFAAHDAHR